MPFPGLSSSGDQLLGECTIPDEPCVLITSLVAAARFPGCTRRTQSQVCCVSPLGSWSQAGILLADVNCPGSQEEVVNKWKPGHHLVEDASLWGWDWSNPLTSSFGCYMPASLPPVGERELYAAGLLSDIHSIICSVSKLGCELEPSVGKFSLFFFFPPLWWSHSLDCYLMLAPLDCPLAFRPSPYPKDQWYHPHLPVQPLLAGGGCECPGYIFAGSCS